MNQMIVSVRDKMLRRTGGVNHFVTHNKDYEIQFQFDDSWADVRHKMAVFAYEDGEYGSEIFEGEVCSVPELPREGKIYVGIKAGDELSTELLCVQVCKSADDVITDEYDVPDPKIYEQILDIMNNLWGGGSTVYPSPVKFLAAPSAAKVGDLVRVEEVDENGDVERTDGFDIDAALEKKIDKPENAVAGQIVKVKSVDEDGKVTEMEAVDDNYISTSGGMYDLTNAVVLRKPSNTDYFAGILAVRSQPIIDDEEEYVYDTAMIEAGLYLRRYTDAISDYQSSLIFPNIWQMLDNHVDGDHMGLYFRPSSIQFSRYNNGWKSTYIQAEKDRTKIYNDQKLIDFVSSRLLNVAAPSDNGDAANKGYVDTKLPTPSTAQVGQIVKVKAVDDTGKITETEAVDFSGSISVTYDEDTGNLQIGG